MKIRFECKTKEEKLAAEEFINWLSNSGEQDYWQHMENAQYDAYLDGEGDITITKIDYKKELELGCEIGSFVEPPGENK